MTIAELQAEILDDLTIELENEPDFSADILAVKIKNAIREAKAKRNYEATTYDESDIADDLYRFYSVIANVARYDYNMIGSEGETSHSENGVSRHYVEREKLFADIYPFVKVL